MHALDWLGDLIHAISLIIPRLILIRSTHAGVVFCRDTVKAIGPGLHLYWPVWSEVQTICMVRQSMNLSSYQCLISKDLQAVSVAAVIVYRVTDPVAALTTTDLLTDTLHDVSLNAIRLIVSSCDFSEIHSNVTAKGKRIDGILRTRLQANLGTYGVHVERAFLSDVARPLMIRLLTETQST